MNEDDIAIIGMSGRFPGANTISKFWENLCQKKESISFFSDEELLAGGVARHLLQDPSYVKAGFILENIDLFDADFFHVSLREATAMDPQHRLSLECAWEALEDGGYIPGEEPLDVGVFLGGGAVTASYLLEYLKKYPEIAGTSANFHAFCTDVHYLATRVSYKLNLTGPSLVVQTACSTSMAAIHLACEAILRNECTMALAGGVSLRIPQRKGYLHSEGDILSSDGHCRTFDAHSSGTVFGSGIGIVLLKKHSQAVADADPIYAVIKKTSMNNDGNSKLSYPAPSVDGQASCITAAFSRSKIDPRSIQFLEAHGTGTVLGDPTEIQSLKQAFGIGAAGYCAIGSVKPNIGHTTAASGVASLIKLSLALYHCKIPAHINFEQLNPKIDFANSPFYINKETIEWTAGQIPRRGAMSSFGVGGTNAFAILEEAPLRDRKKIDPPIMAYPFTLSAKTQEALKDQVRQLQCFLNERPEATLCDIAFTLNVKRKHFACRLFFEASSRDECLSILKQRRFEESRSKQADRAAFDLEDLHWHETLDRLKDAYLDGAAIDWRKIHDLIGGQTIHLPTYPFQRKRYWIDVPKEKETHALRIHPLLGWKINTSLVSEELLFENIFQSDELDYLKDHRILDQNIYPAAAYIETFCAAAQAVGISLPLRLRDVEIKTAMLIRPALHLQTKLKVIDGGYEAGVYRFDQNQWHHHASARIEPLKTSIGPQDPNRAAFVSDDSIDSNYFYSAVAAQGYQFGPHFKTLRNLWKSSSGFSIGRAVIEDSTDLYTLYPPLFDGAAQLTLNPHSPHAIDSLTLPVHIGEIEIFRRLPNSIHITAEQDGNESFLHHIVVYDLSGNRLIEIKKHKKKKVDKSTLYRLLNSHNDPQFHFLYHEMPLLSSSLKDRSAPIDGLRLFICFEKTPFIQGILHCLGEDLCVTIELHTVSLDLLPSILQELFQKNICGIVQFLPDSSEELKFEAFVTFLQICLNRADLKMPPLFTISSGLFDSQRIHPMAAFIGLHRTLQQEFPDHRFVHIDIGTTLSEKTAIELLARELTHGDGESEIVLQEEGRYINRIVSRDEFIEKHQSLPIPELGHYGLQKGMKISDLTFQAIRLPDLREREVEIAVLASALNFRDVLNALGLYPGEPSLLGSDICGVITRKGDQVQHLEIGQTVFGIAEGAFQNRVIVSSECVALKPDRLSPIEAAAIPIVFLTAYHALIQLAGLQKGEKVLIHCATGGVGLAAIQIAKQVGAEIFATASTSRKRAYLQSLGIANIASSRTLDFVDEWKGRSIDVVLNSLTGHGFIEGAVHICAPKARFLELGKRNIRSKEQMAALRQDIRYWIVAIDAMKQEKPEQIRDLLESIANQLQQGLLNPLPHTLFPLTQIQSAFEYLHQTQQIGKVVIKHPSAWKENLLQGSYLITGGFGELGMKTAQWLIDQGAKHFCLVGRSFSQKMDAQLDIYRKKGIEIVAKSCDVSCEEAVDRLFSEWKGPPFKGIIHAAGLLHTAGFLQHTWADFKRILTPKIQGAWMLHKAVLKHRIDLDWMVYYSSISGVLGSHGNSAYSAANSFLNQFARYQQQLGLPVISVNWGAWGESGMAASLLEQMKSRGAFDLTPAEAFRGLDLALQAQEAAIGVMNIDWNLYISTMVKKNFRFDWLRKKALLSSGSASASTIVRKKSPLKDLSSMQDYLASCIRKILGLSDEHRIDIEELFIRQGVDSLQAIEFLSQIERDLRLHENLRMAVLQNHPTVLSLSQYLLEHQAAQNTPDSEQSFELPAILKQPLKEQGWSFLSEHMKIYWKSFRSNNYNIGTAIRFPLRVDIQRLSEALNEVFKQNPIFYLSIPLDRPAYKIAPYQDHCLTIQTLDQDGDCENQLGLAYQKLIKQPFAPSDFPKCRAVFYQMEPNIFELQIVCPHMIADGRSFHLLLESIDLAYTALMHNQKPSLYSPQKDFLVQQVKYEAIVMENQEHKKDLIQQYHKHFRPFRLQRSMEEKKGVPSLILKYSIDIREQFTSACQTIGIQLSLAFNGLIALALSLITKQTQVSAACASDGLFSADFSNVIGPFHKQLPLNISREESDTLHDFIQRLKGLQPFWTYLREYPPELLTVSQGSKIGVKTLEKLVQKKLLPKAIIPLLRNKKAALVRLLQKLKLNHEGAPIYLFINEMNLKGFSNFVDIYQNRLPQFHQENSSQVRVISLLMQKEWEIHVTWPLNPQNQSLLSQNIDSLIQHFITSRQAKIEDCIKDYDLTVQ